VAAGRYEGTVAAARPGLYRVDVSQERPAGEAPGAETGAFAVSASPEFRRLGSNDALLKQMAAMTGGRTITDPSQVFSREGLPPSHGWQPLWSYLLALALLLLPIEVAMRRIRAPFVRRRAAEAEEEQAVEMRPAEREDRAA